MEGGHKSCWLECSEDCFQLWNSKFPVWSIVIKPGTAINKTTEMGVELNCAGGGCSICGKVLLFILTFSLNRQ